MFNQTSTPDTLANARRLQGAIDLSDIWQSARGRGSVYWQDRQAGFSGAGALATTDAIKQQGAAFSVPLNARTSIDVKADDKSSATDRIDGEEAAVHYQINDSWGASVGARYDDRHNDVANASTLLSENGARTDAIVRAHPEILECYTLMGETDFLLRIVCRDIRAYEAFFLDHLSRFPGVQSVNSSIALAVIKETTALPLHL